MNKQEFLDRLKVSLSELPPEELEERLNFYREIIDDRMEEGLSEEQAVAQLSLPSISEVPHRKPGFWQSLLLGLKCMVLIPVCVTLWTVVASMWLSFAVGVASTLCGFVAGLGYLSDGIRDTGLMLLGVGCFWSAVSIFIFFLSLLATRFATAVPKKWISGGVDHG